MASWRTRTSRALLARDEHADDHPIDYTTFFLGRETLVPKLGAEMALWREKLFVAMYRNAGSIADYFNLPSEPRGRARFADRAVARGRPP